MSCFRIQITRYFFQNSHYIRCIRSNSLKKEGQFEKPLVLEQLKTSCTIAFAEFMSLGYPNHVCLEKLFDAYQPIYKKFRNLYSKSNFVAKCLLSLGLSLKDFKIGKQYILTRSKKDDALKQLLSSDPNTVQSVNMKTKRFLAQSKWKSWITCILFLLRCVYYMYQEVMFKSILKNIHFLQGKKNVRKTY